jgi:hypothetical protein
MVALAALFLVAVLYALWQSVRALLVEGADRAIVASEPAAAREALLREKETLLRAIREAEMDRDVGKLSERDFERLNARLRARAREVLAALEAQVAPHRERARALVAGAGGNPTQTDGPSA